MTRGVLIGRDPERTWLEAALRDAVDGRGSLVLVAGEAGVGKTRLTEEAMDAAAARFLRGAPGPTAQAYGPLIAALREFMRSVPEGLGDVGPLRPHLALLLPELGPGSPASDRA